MDILNELKALINKLDEEGIEYALCGGLAINVINFSQLLCSTGGSCFCVLVYEGSDVPAVPVRLISKTRLTELAAKTPRYPQGGSTAAGWRIS